MSAESSIFSPLAAKDFRGLIGSHAAGVFNDNLFKQAFVLAMAFGAENGAIAAAAVALYTAPFFLFASLAGAVADRFDKARSYRALKLAEIGLMGAACVGFAVDSTPLLLGTLGLMGMQSAFLGPLRQGLLTERLAQSRWSASNAWMSATTFLAILIGMAAAGLLAVTPAAGVWSGVLAILCAGAGWLSARRLTVRGRADPDRRIDPNLAAGVAKLLAGVLGHRTLRGLALLIAWFWFMGALAMSAVPIWVREALGGTEATATALMALFAVGVGAGAVASQSIGRGKPSWAVSALGAGLISASASVLACVGAAEMSAADLLRTTTGLSVSGAVLTLALGGGLFITPLQTRLQIAAPLHRRGEVFAAGGAINAIASTIAAGVVTLLTAASIPPASAFLIAGALNAPVVLHVALRAFGARHQGAPAACNHAISAAAASGSR